MQKFAKLIGTAAIVGTATFAMSSAKAWWGGGCPWNGLGDGWGDFNRSRQRLPPWIWARIQLPLLRTRRSLWLWLGRTLRLWRTTARTHDWQ